MNGSKLAPVQVAGYIRASGDILMTDEEINRLVEPILRKWLSASGFRRSKTRSGEDHDGDPSLFITAHFERGRMPNSLALLRSAGEIRHRLRAAGDTRFPYVQPRIPDRREAAE